MMEIRKKNCCISKYHIFQESWDYLKMLQIICMEYTKVTQWKQKIGLQAMIQTQLWGHNNLFQQRATDTEFLDDDLSYWYTGTRLCYL